MEEKKYWCRKCGAPWPTVYRPFEEPYAQPAAGCKYCKGGVKVKSKDKCRKQWKPREIPPHVAFAKLEPRPCEVRHACGE